MDTFLALRQTPLFAGLPDDELLTLAEQAEVHTFEAGMIIFREHEPGGTLFVVKHGEVELYVRDRGGMEVMLLKVEPGHVFGEMSLLDDRPRSASARTVGRTVLIGVTRETLIRVTEARPSVAIHLLQTLAGRLRNTSAMVQERVIPNATDVIEVKSTWSDRISDFFTNVSGSLYFVLFSLVWFTVWIVWNSNLIPGLQPFDPFPFGFLTMLVSLEMVFLSLFILIKQGRQSANDKVRDDIEYEVNVRAELGIRQLGEQLEALERRVMTRMDRLEAERVTLPEREN